MTLIAGAFSIDKRQAIPAALQAALSQHVSRDNSTASSVRTLTSPRCFAIKVDIGAYQEPALIEEPDGSFSALMGDALICDRSVRLSRMLQASALQMACDAGDEAVFSRARGTFAFVRFNSSQGTLTMVSDAIGVRPLYYCVQDGYLVFGSALRMLESIEFVTKTTCLKGLAEQLAFGYAIGERTPYEEIKLLRESQVLTCDASGARTRGYLNWSDSTPAYGGYAEAVDSLADVFKTSVRLRAGTDRRTRAFLSGGLDSRSIVGTLIDQGVHVDAVNFAFPGAQDEAFARAFAENAGAACFLHAVSMDSSMFPLEWSRMMADALTDLSVEPEHPRLIWSGDGGSVGLGHVYIDATVIELFKQDRKAAGIAQFLASNKIVLPLFVFKSSASDQLSDALVSAISQEMERYPHRDLGRQLYLFLLLNSNRRHMHGHFENIDQHKLEFHMPFYDAAFMQQVCAFPSELCIEHRLYVDWLERLPAILRQSPWQTYPGHVPCPIALEGDFEYQWSVEQPTFVDRIRATTSAVELLRSTLSAGFPHQFISRTKTAVLAALYFVRLQNCDYVNRVVDEFATYSRSS